MKRLFFILALFSLSLNAVCATEQDIVDICVQRLLADKIGRRVDNLLYKDTAISPASTMCVALRHFA